MALEKRIHNNPDFALQIARRLAAYITLPTLHTELITNLFCRIEDELSASSLDKKRKATTQFFVLYVLHGQAGDELRAMFQDIQPLSEQGRASVIIMPVLTHTYLNQSGGEWKGGFDGHGGSMFLK